MKKTIVSLSAVALFAATLPVLASEKASTASTGPVNTTAKVDVPATNATTTATNAGVVVAKDTTPTRDKDLLILVNPVTTTAVTTAAPATTYAGKDPVELPPAGNTGVARVKSDGTVVYDRPSGVAATAMHRLYNPNSGEHFYTANEAEKNHLASIGWKYEGVAWLAPETGADVYRLYNPNAGDHHYTLDVSERDHLVKLGWKYEGVSWKSAGQVPLYRLYNPNATGAGSHHYTVSVTEKDYLDSIGWNYEGIAWTAIAAQ